MTTTPIIRGEWLRPGQHLDLIGAYRPDMREADDEVLRRGRLFVDARHTTIGHIGEVMIPMEAGVIGEEDILADYYDLSSGAFARPPMTRSRLQERRRCASGPDVRALHPRRGAKRLIAQAAAARVLQRLFADRQVDHCAERADGHADPPHRV
jgi:hypothetical protein